MNETTDYKKLATAYMVNTYSRMCSLRKYHNVIAKSTDFDLDIFLEKMFQNHWADDFVDSKYSGNKSTLAWNSSAIELFLADKLSEEPAEFLTFAQDDFRDFLDYYSDFIILWMHYNDQGLIPDSVNFDMVKNDLAELCSSLSKDIKENEAYDEYHEKADQMFKDYMNRNGWMKKALNSDTVFYHGKWYIADLENAVEGLQEDGIVPKNCNVDYRDLAKYVKQQVFTDHTDENERIRNAVENYVEEHDPLYLTKQEIGLFAEIVAGTMNRSITGNSMYQCFLKAHGWKSLTVEQIVEILGRSARFDEDSFIEENLVGPRLEIWRKINDYAKISVV